MLRAVRVAAISIHAPRVGGDLELLGRHLGMFTISIHAPRVGGDCHTLRPRLTYSPISIHAPRVGGDFFTLDFWAGIGISIHAPRVGGDHWFEASKAENLDFNPRPPCGGRRPRNRLEDPLWIISIHAPRVGGDSKNS